MGRSKGQRNQLSRVCTLAYLVLHLPLLPRCPRIDPTAVQQDFKTLTNRFDEFGSFGEGDRSARSSGGRYIVCCEDWRHGGGGSKSQRGRTSRMRSRPPRSTWLVISTAPLSLLLCGRSPTLYGFPRPT